MSYMDEILNADKSVDYDRLCQVVKDSIVGEGLVNTICALGDLANLQNELATRVAGDVDDEKLLKALANAHIALECIQQVSGLTNVTVSKAINIELSKRGKKSVDI